MLIFFYINSKSGTEGKLKSIIHLLHTDFADGINDQQLIACLLRVFDAVIAYSMMFINRKILNPSNYLPDLARFRTTSSRLSDELILRICRRAFKGKATPA